MLHLRYTHVTFAEDEQTREEGVIAFKCIMRCFINCVYLGFRLYIKIYKITQRNCVNRLT